MTEHTPDKVNELITIANAMREQVGADNPRTDTILDLWFRTADALAAVSAERDAYKRAKAENDERFLIERDEARRERDAALAVIPEAERDAALAVNRILSRIPEAGA